jgi:hypothetical protein
MRSLLAGMTLLVVAGCTSGTGGSLTVDGRIDLGPACPVERAGSPCPVPPGAFAGVEAIARSDGRVVRVPVQGDGSFRLSLDAGEWEVTATAGMSCATVTVTASGPAAVTCDTGIR